MGCEESMIEQRVVREIDRLVVVGQSQSQAKSCAGASDLLDFCPSTFEAWSDCAQKAFGRLSRPEYVS
jgi:hypothetical protein